METRTCQGFAARRDYETCGQPIYTEVIGRSTISFNPDGSRHTCRHAATGLRPGTHGSTPRFPKRPA